MKLEYFILGMVKLNPRTGYDLKKVLDREGRFMRGRTPLSQIYTTLKRMREKGWIEYEEIPREGVPDLKVYSLTPEGDQIFMEWLRAPHQPDFRFQERGLYGKLGFACFLENETILQHLRAELNYNMEQIATFRHRDRNMQISPSCDADPIRAQAIADLMHEYGAGAVDHYVAWLKHTIEFFEKEQPEVTK
jgi:DNA-binding PadR family transcriptional regulator